MPLPFTQGDAAYLIAKGQRMVKLPNPVYLLRQDEPFRVQTTEGEMTGNPGDYIAHDPISGHV